MEKGVRGATFGNVMEIPAMKARVITLRLANDLSTEGSLLYLMYLGFYVARYFTSARHCMCPLE